MSKTEKFKKKQGKTKKKNDLPVFESEADFLAAFFEENRPASPPDKKKSRSIKNEKSRINKHGLPFIEDYETRFLPDPDEGPGSSESVTPVSDRPGGAEVEEEDFARLLEESLKEKKIPRHIPKPMPLKRRLKRYPPPEADLDLHGFTAVGAEIKARSFITTAKIQGFFTLRIVVGRGLHSQEGPVLPHVVEALLQELKKYNIVLSYKWEGVKKKQSGAVLVYLKQFSD